MDDVVDIVAMTTFTGQWWT